METQKPDAAKPRDIIEFLREEQRQRKPQGPKPRWVVELLEEVSKPFSEEQKARLDEAMRLAQGTACSHEESHPGDHRVHYSPDAG